MGAAERDFCFFRQLANIEVGDELPHDVARAMETPDVPICSIGGCAMRGQDLMNLAEGDRGLVELAEERQRRAAPSCELNSPLFGLPPEAVDSEIGRLETYFANPQEGGGSQPPVA